MEQPGKRQTIVIDASALLAVYLREPEAARVADMINEHPDRLISAITVTEVLIRLLRQNLITPQAFETDLETMNIRVTDVDFDQASVAATARRRYPLNLGDCFVYALASLTGSAIVTLDNDFRNCDVPVLNPS